MSEAFVGEIRLFGGNYSPVNWHKCDGSMLSVSNYQVLYSLLGTTYGGDGVNTFGLPDLRSRLPVGMGQGTNLTNRVIAQKFGEETVALASNQLPVHTHTLVATSTQASSDSPSNAVFAKQVDGDKLYVEAKSTNQPVALATASISNSGSGAPHDNVMPCLGITYIICLNGIYPTRN